MTIFNLTAQLKHPEAPALYKDCFCYDEPSLGITAEPLIHITTAAIQKLLAPATPQQIQLAFSTELQPDWSWHAKPSGNRVVPASKRFDGRRAEHRCR